MDFKDWRTLLFHSSELRRSLHARGWFESCRRKYAVGVDGHSLPETTYAFAEFLKPRVRSDWRVLAIGSRSTARWLHRMTEAVTLVGRYPAKRSGIQFVDMTAPEFRWSELPSKLGRFDLVMIRGKKGFELLPGILTEAGVVAVSGGCGDGAASLSRQLEPFGFRRLEFYGLVPGGGGAATWLFYRFRNIAGI